MDEQIQNQMTPEMMPSGDIPNPPPEKKEPNKAVLASVILILIVVLGGVFLWKTSVKEKVGEEKIVDIGEREASTAPSGDQILINDSAALETQDESDDLSSIDNDLHKTNIDHIDQGY